MRRTSPAQIPSVPLADGDRLRVATRADIPELVTLFQAAFPEMDWEPAKVREELVDDPRVVRIYVVQRLNRIVATASCKRSDEEKTGYLHWCAVHPNARGERLGTVVCQAVLRSFAKQGMTSVLLDTDDHRLAAIKTYLRLEFIPEPCDQEDRERWERIFALLLPSSPS